MDDVQLRQLKRALRPGDELRVTIDKFEPEGEKSVMHVASAELLSLSVRSNTGVERTVVPAKRSGGELPLPPPPVPTRPAPSQQPRPTSLEQEAADEHDGAGEAPHSERAKIFAEWVLTAFADVLLGGGGDGGSRDGTCVGGSGSSGSILDVAGGKGELSLHLALSGHRVTLVDPRPTSGFLSKWQRKLLRRSGQPPFTVHVMPVPKAYERTKSATITRLTSDHLTGPVCLYTGRARALWRSRRRCGRRYRK